MARGVEQVPPMGGVDIEEDTRDDDCLLFKQLLKERLFQKEGSQYLKTYTRKSRREPTKPLFKGAGKFSRFNQM